ncbi:tail fiber protein [Aquimarina aggregata]|uniref:tail fiber protein n=1 Tax=Aquimarina aggregata TaxID=1642818 RepID=UPI002490E042|nr:tail fiber protein [Aquimarina aggregata]
MKKVILVIIVFTIVLTAKAQDETVNGILTINKNISQPQKPYSLLKLKTNNGVYDGNNGPAIEFATNIGLGKIAGVDERSNNSSTYQGGLVFKTRLHTQGNDSGFYERMRITSNGNIGIGTNNPNVLLELSKSEDLGNAAMLKLKNQGAVFKKNSGPSIEFSTNIGLAKILGVDERSNNSSTYQGGLVFKTRLHNQGNDSGFYERMRIIANGNVGIGTATPDARLTVKGKIHAEEVKIDLSVPAPDYVFKKEYELLTIDEVQQHIKEKGHLPNIPSAEVMENNGIELGAMNMKLLEKIEELTLYTIAQEKEIKTLKEQQQQNTALAQRVEDLEKIIENLLNTSTNEE